MANFITIFKLLFKSMFRSNRQSGEKNSTKTAVIVVVAVAYLFVAAFICFIAYFLGQSFYVLDLLNEFIAVLFGIAALIVLIFGFIALFNALYFSKDSEFFLTLPVKPWTIFLAKFSLVYLTELLIAGAILVPALITLGVAAQLFPLYYFLIFIGIVLAPSLPLVLASIISIPLMYVIGFFRNKGALTSILMMVLFGGFFAVYYMFIIQMQNTDIYENPEMIVEGMKSSFTVIANILYPYLAFARFATLSEFGGLSQGVSVLLSALIFLCSTAVLFALAMIVANIVYKRGASSQLENIKAKSSGKEKFTEGNALSALIRKEWKELLRTPAFSMQCLLGVILTPILVGILSFTTFSGFAASFAESGVSEATALELQWFICFSMILMFGVGMNITASSAITREGQNFYFSKMIPVDYQTQINAKRIVALIVSMISSVLGLVVLTVFTLNFVYLLLGIGTSFLYAVGYNDFAIFLDLKKPKLDWATPNEAVKQNFRLMVPYLLNMVLTIILLVAPILVIIFVGGLAASIINWAILFAVSVAIFFGLSTLLKKNISKLYENVTF